MTHEEIRYEIGRLIEIELKHTTEFLTMLRIAEDKRTYAAFEYTSLYGWLTSYFKYSHSSAMRRLQAVKLMRCVPDVEDRLEQGTLNLSTLNTAQTTFNAHEKATGEKLADEAKAAAVEQIENMSAAQAEQALLERFPEAAPEVTKPRKRKFKNGVTRHTLNLSKAAEEKLIRLKELLSHKFPDGREEDILEHLSDYYSDRKDPLRKSAADMKRFEKGKTSKAQDKRSAVQATYGSCCYKYEDGHICGIRYQIETDHAHPLGKGGADTRDNYRCYCRAYNQIAGDRAFGREHMNKSRRRRKSDNPMPSQTSFI